MTYTFRDILTQAVADISTNGYESPDQIEHWLRLLREAAEHELGTPERIDAEMQAALFAIFGRLVDKGGVDKYVPGVPRYTLQMVRPQLRAELDRRIMAATDLIRLRRHEAVNKTLAQVSGWATSIPMSGVSDETRTEVKKRVGKQLTQYRFECRRVAIDQGMKLVSNVSEIVALDNGAIAGVWHSHWRRQAYDFRREHKDFDEKIFVVRGNWAIEKGLIKLDGCRYTDEVERPAQLPYCTCYYQWITSIRRLPQSMLTEKGKDFIKRGSTVSAA
jgi:hypothetical protein